MCILYTCTFLELRDLRLNASARIYLKNKICWPVLNIHANRNPQMKFISNPCCEIALNVLGYLLYLAFRDFDQLSSASRLIL